MLFESLSRIVTRKCHHDVSLYPFVNSIDTMKRFILIILLSITQSCSAEIFQEEVCHINQDADCCSDENSTKDSFLSKSVASDGSLFRAAVLEHRIFDDPSSQVRSVDENLATFKRVAKIAAENGVNVLVFPEDGLYSPTSEFESVLQHIPDPHSILKNESNPCQQATLYESSYILRNLSCMARENNLYLVANFGTREDCKPETHVGSLECPKSGYLAFNTDVVIDPDGNFIERYRKYNTFLEFFARAPSLETVYFDTPYGRFGVFTCFDILFMEPAVKLVEKYHIDTAIFPTLWYDELPILSGIQFQDAWSWANQVNLLASNIHRPKTGTTGSGIFSGFNTLLTHSFTDQKSSLLIANLPIKPKSSPKYTKNFDKKIIDLDSGLEDEPYINYNYALTKDDFIHVLKKSEDKQTICQGQVCCSIDYKISPSFSDKDFSGKLIVIVRDSIRTPPLPWYEQVCFLATLKEPFDPENLTKTTYSRQGLVGFERLNLKGTFRTKYVYPIAAYNVSDLIKRCHRAFNCDISDSKHEDQFACNLIMSPGSRNKALNSFGMYGRAYDCDKMPEWWLNGIPFRSTMPAPSTLAISGAIGNLENMVRLDVIFIVALLTCVHVVVYRINPFG